MLFTVYIPLILCAQAKVAFLDSTSDKMSWYAQSKPSSTLFVHLDKNIYAPTEIIWFRAYIINSRLELEKNNTLSVALIRMEDRKVCLQSKFLMRQGLSSGSLLLPDSLTPGKYSFVSYTNVLAGGAPLALFTQPIEIRTAGSTANHLLQDSSSLSNRMVETQAPVIRFYPEGGHLVWEVTSTVGWEAKDGFGHPLALAAVVLENGKPSDSVKTAASGMGTFRLKPKQAVHYQLKLPLKNGQDTLYDFPSAASAGPVISLATAWAGDTLKLGIESKEEHTFYLLLHNFKQLYKAFTLRVRPGVTPVVVPLALLPKGLATLTVLDSLYYPLAERLFFAHTDNKPVLAITMDSSFYHTRSKVQVHLKLQNCHREPLQGIFSIACVQKNRINPRLFQSIDNYTYLEHELGQSLGEVALSTTSRQEKEFLEDLLLIKGWANYNWQGLLAAKASDTAEAYGSLSIYGIVNRNGKALKRPVDVFLMNDSSLRTITTNPTGYFSLEPDHLVASPGRKVSLFLNNKLQGGLYKIHLEDPYPSWNESLARQIQFKEAPVLVGQLEEKSYLPEPISRYKTLETVVIKSRSRDQEFYDRQFYVNPLIEIYEGSCRDWVCLANVLNCPNHPMGVPPVQGEKYYVYTRTKGIQLMVYHNNCKWSSPLSTVFYSLDGVKQSRQSYAFDFSKLAPDDPQYLTTLYWNASVITDGNGEANLSFYTSDIPATFKIIVQGRTESDVVSSNASFVVRPQAH